MRPFLIDFLIYFCLLYAIFIKTILSQIWDENRTTKLADVTITVVSAVGGDITWKVTDTQTTNMTDNIYRYDSYYQF